MEEHNLEFRIQVLSALADKTRLSLIKKIAEGPIQGSSCASLSVGFNSTQPALSHHFKILVSSGVIIQRKEGRGIYYIINHDLLESVGIKLSKLLI